VYDVRTRWRSRRGRTSRSYIVVRLGMTHFLPSLSFSLVVSASSYPPSSLFVCSSVVIVILVSKIDACLRGAVLHIIEHRASVHERENRRNEERERERENTFFFLLNSYSYDRILHRLLLLLHCRYTSIFVIALRKRETKEQSRSQDNQFNIIKFISYTSCYSSVP
jgi:hypothetical protein